jgi:hypothetical protein
MTPKPSGATSVSRGDWRPPTSADWTRLRTLLREVRIYLEPNADKWEDAEKDMLAIGGEMWAIGIGRYRDRAALARELATWLEDEYHALSGGHQRKVELDDRGMFPGTLAP